MEHREIPSGVFRNDSDFLLLERFLRAVLVYKPESIISVVDYQSKEFGGDVSLSLKRRCTYSLVDIMRKRNSFRLQECYPLLFGVAKGFDFINLHQFPMFSSGIHCVFVNSRSGTRPGGNEDLSVELDPFVNFQGVTSSRNVVAQFIMILNHMMGAPIAYDRGSGRFVPIPLLNQASNEFLEAIMNDDDHCSAAFAGEMYVCHSILKRLLQLEKIEYSESKTAEDSPGHDFRKIPAVSKTLIETIKSTELTDQTESGIKTKGELIDLAESLVVLEQELENELHQYERNYRSLNHREGEFRIKKQLQVSELNARRKKNESELVAMFSRLNDQLKGRESALLPK